MSEESEQTFTRDDVQTWLDGLDDKHSAMLAHVVDTHAMQASIDVLGNAAEAVADVARRHAAKGKRKASAAVREVVGVLLRVQRQAEGEAIRHAGGQPSVMQ